MTFMTVLLRHRSGTTDSGTQLSLPFTDMPGTVDRGRVRRPDVDGLAPVRGVMFSLAFAVVMWAGLFAVAWALLH